MRKYRSETGEQTKIIEELRDLNQRMTTESVKLLQEAHALEENGHFSRH